MPATTQWSEGPQFRPGGSQAGRPQSVSPRPANSTYYSQQQPYQQPVKESGKPSKKVQSQYQVHKLSKPQTRPPASYSGSQYSSVPPASARPTSPPKGTGKSANAPSGTGKSMPAAPRKRRNDTESWPPPGVQYSVWTGEEYEMRPPPGPSYGEMRGISPRRRRSHVKVVKCVDLTDSNVNSFGRY